MGCDFVSGHTHTRSTLFVLYIHATNTARGVSLAHTLDFVHEPFIKGFLKTRKPVDDVVVTNARGFYTVMSSLPAYLKYDGTNWLPKSASTADKRSSGRFQREGYLGSWKFKLRSTKRKDLFFEMSLESSTS